MSDLTKIQPIEICNAVGKCNSHPSSYASSLNTYSKPTQERVANYALQALEKARAADVAMHDKNLPLLEINKAIAARIEVVMTEVGIPRSYSERDHKSRARYPKSITHAAGWIGDVQRNCKTDDSFAHATSTYQRLLEAYKAFAVEAQGEAARLAADRQREADAELAKRKADMELAAILLRYELPITSTWSDVLEALTAKNQRLDLAVAMQQTRGDWSDGPYRVTNALGRFQIENTEDKDIANDILSCLEDFEDGRVFRDTTWNYSRLFASVEDQQLVADVQLALSKGDDS